MKVKRFVLATFAFLLAVIIPTSVWGANPDPDKPTAGDGSENNPYQINTKGNLLWFINLVNGTGIEQNKAACAKLTDSLLLEEDYVLPAMEDFEGTFDGGNHSISNLAISTPDADATGMFNIVSGTVKNLNLQNVNITGGANVGALCSVLKGTVDNCTVEGAVAGHTNVGGIVGIIEGGKITNSVNNATVTHTDATYVKEHKNIGGVCGYNNAGTISKCCNTASVISANDYVGGIVGFNSNSGVIEYCKNVGDANAKISGGNYYVGGICGRNGEIVANSSGCSIKFSSNSMEVSSLTCVGGICGTTGPASVVANCVNTGKVTATATGTDQSAAAAGGIVGWAPKNTNQEQYTTIIHCYNSAVVTSGADHAGGIIGYIPSGKVKVSNCYYNSEYSKRTGIYTSYYEKDAIEENCGGKTSAQELSGDVALALNDYVEDGSQVWYQTIGTDALPHFNKAADGSNTVYKLATFEGIDLGCNDLNNPYYKELNAKDYASLASLNPVCDFKVGSLTFNYSIAAQEIKALVLPFDLELNLINKNLLLYEAKGDGTDSESGEHLLVCTGKAEIPAYQPFFVHNPTDAAIDLLAGTAENIAINKRPSEISFTTGDDKWTVSANFTETTQSTGYILSGSKLQKIVTETTVEPYTILFNTSIEGFDAEEVSIKLINSYPQLPVLPQGAGTAESPYQITTEQELIGYVALVNGTFEGYEKQADASAVLKNDIVMLGGWIPVETLDAGATFDGGSYSIDGIIGNAFIRSLNGEVKNLTLKNYQLSASGTDNVGGIASLVNSGASIDNCHVESGKIYIDNCRWIGGIAGRLNKNATITNCSNRIAIEAINSSVIGGVSGISYGTIIKCSNYGSVVATKSKYNSEESIARFVGGICGSSMGAIEDCCNIGSDANSIISGLDIVGGICGSSSYSEGDTEVGKGVVRSYNTMNVSASDSWGIVGGIAGQTDVRIYCCYNTGTVTGLTRIGGILGRTTSTVGLVEGCFNYSTVNVTGTGTTKAGGIVGECTGTVTNSYYCTDLCNLDNKKGVGYTKADFASGKIAALLNEGIGSMFFRQELNPVTPGDASFIADIHPKFTGRMVYIANPEETAFENAYRAVDPSGILQYYVWSIGSIYLKNSYPLEFDDESGLLVINQFRYENPEIKPGEFKAMALPWGCNYSGQVRKEYRQFNYGASAPVFFDIIYKLNENLEVYTLDNVDTYASATIINLKKIDCSQYTINYKVDTCSGTGMGTLTYYRCGLKTEIESNQPIFVYNPTDTNQQPLASYPNYGKSSYLCYWNTHKLLWKDDRKDYSFISDEHFQFRIDEKYPTLSTDGMWQLKSTYKTIERKPGMYVLSQIDGNKEMVGTYDRSTIRPWECYLQCLDPNYDLDVVYFSVEGKVSGVVEVEADGTIGNQKVNVYDLNGRLVRANVDSFFALKGLNPGIYIVNGKKVLVK